MSEWLDTETKAMLQQAPPEKLAPPDTGMFSLVLLKMGDDPTRTRRALERIPRVSGERAVNIATRQCPAVVIASGLSLGDAILGQFELVCCDSISVFLRDEVAASNDRSYLSELFQQFRESPEFESIPATITLIPQTAPGRQFVDQFLGGMSHVASCPHRGYFYEGKIMRKKARIMAHWAKKIGAEVVVANDPSGERP
jgi:hypothetical protein